MGRIVVITGASSGIGEALAIELGRRGDSLVLASRTLDALERVAARVGGQTKVVRTDVTKRADVEQLRDRAIEAFGGVDVWINNVGKGIVRSAIDLTDEDIDEMMAFNVKSALYGVQAIVPHFVERGRGHIVNISSFLGRVPDAPLRSAYSAAKAALNSLTANLRVDLGRTHPGIRVSLVMPALVTTEFARHARGSTSAAPAAAIGSRTKPQAPEEVATIIANVLDQPVAELYTNPGSRPLADRYFADVGRFEAESYPPR